MAAEAFSSNGAQAMRSSLDVDKPALVWAPRSWAIKNDENIFTVGRRGADINLQFRLNSLQESPIYGWRCGG